MLSDFETSQGKLLQIILAGQRQLANTLMKPEMLQLTQRISVTQFLDPLDSNEVGQYVRHRLGVAGYDGKPLFTPDALDLVAGESGGIPRNINNICFGALSTAFALGRKRIDCEIVEEVASDQNVRSLASENGQVRVSGSWEGTQDSREGGLCRPGIQSGVHFRHGWADTPGAPATS